MVRPRVQLERLNGELSREHFFLHNRSVISKKVKEMSILTGADLLFLTFSPSSGFPSLCLGQNTDFMRIISRFSEISYHDREKRRLDNLHTLRANYHKDGYNIDVEMLHKGWKTKRLEALDEELRMLKDKLSDLNYKKSIRENQKSNGEVEKMKDMEGTLPDSTEEMCKCKMDSKQILKMKGID